MKYDQKLTIKHQNDVNDNVLVFLLLNLNIFHTFFTVSTVEFEQVNVIWVGRNMSIVLDTRKSILGVNSGYSVIFGSILHFITKSDIYIITNCGSYFITKCDKNSPQNTSSVFTK